MVLRKSSEREDPRVLRTRQLLLQAFSDLFAERDFYAITVQDITDRACVNRGTFYTHFEDKPALLEYWLREQLQQRTAAIIASSDLWNLSTFRLFILKVVEWFTQLHKLTRSADRSLIPLVVTTLQEALFELLLQGFKPFADAGKDQQVALETVALVTSWAIFGAGFLCFHQWDERTEPLSSEELVKQVTSILVGGLAQALPLFPLRE